MLKPRVNLLLVEDNPGDAYLVETMLADVGGFNMTWVSCLADAGASLSQNNFDAVLLDLSLPDCKGMDTVRAIRSAASPELAIVLFTGLDDEDVGLKALQEGCQDYLVKGQGDANLIRRTVNHAVERKSIEKALRDSEGRYRGLVELSPDAIIVHRNGKVAFVNWAAVDLLGAEDRKDLIGRKIEDLVHPGCRKSVLEKAKGDLGEPWDRRYMEEKFLRIGGKAVDVEVAGRKIAFHGLPAVQLVARDISGRKKAEEGMRLASTVFQTAAEAIVVTDSKNKIRAVNPAFTKITGYMPEEVLGKSSAFLSSGRYDEGFYKNMWAELNKAGHWEGEIWSRRRFGEAYPGWFSISAVKDLRGRVVEYAAVFSDITNRKKDEEDIRRQANFDALTNLPNRTLFMDRLSRAVVTARRDGRVMALLFVDLDRFKIVNDTLGHAIGDMLLKRVAQRLSGCVREADTVARLGGDEFTVILQDIHKEADAAVVAGEIIKSVSWPFRLGGNKVFVGASVGITVYPADTEDVSSLLHNADMAMYQAKEAGRNVFRFFTRELNKKAALRLALEQDLRYAIDRNEMLLHYQPILDSKSKNVVGVEALARWDHPKRGLLFPGDFAQVAKETGISAKIGEWVLRESSSQMKAWRQVAPDLWLSVNISSSQVKRGLTPQKIGGILDEAGLSHKALVLEISEHLIMGKTRDFEDWIADICAMGIKLAIGNFGAGYSPLNCLRRYPAHMLKIDRTFISPLPDSPEDSTLVDAIIVLAHSLGLKVVGEGVEDGRQLSFLSGRGCDMVQGYYFSRPVTAEKFGEFLTRK